MAKSFTLDQLTGDVVPHFLAPAGSLLLDALPPISSGQNVLEICARVGFLSGPLSVHVEKAGAKMVLLEERPSFLQYVPKVCPRIRAMPVQIPFVGQSFDHVVANCAFFPHGLNPRALSEVERVLKPGGTFVSTWVLRGTFLELADLLREACEQEGLTEFAQSIDEHTVAPSDDEIVDALFERGFQARVGMLEHAVLFNDGPALIADPFVRRTALKLVCGDGAQKTQVPPAALSRLARAVDAYFEESAFAVRVRFAVITALKPISPVLAPPRGL